MIIVVMLYACAFFSSNKYIVLDTATIPIIYFDFGDSSIDSTSAKTLISMVSFYKENQSLNLILRGYSDVDECEKSDTLLSYDRAVNVKKLFVKRGIEKKKITVKALGGNDPVTSGRSKEEKRKNRRVEIVFVD